MLIGIDEVGRGCWAGPLVVAAVALEKNVPGLRDSKKTSEKQRLSLDSLIRSNTRFISIIEVSNKTIDEIGLTASLSFAMKKAVIGLKLDNYSQIIIDGNYNFLSEFERSSTLVKADSKVDEVMAASIVAKVYRDNIMRNFENIYPGYDFKNNVGYGTKKHIDALNNLGVTPIHRYSYKPIRNLSV